MMGATSAATGTVLDRFKGALAPKPSTPTAATPATPTLPPTTAATSAANASVAGLAAKKRRARATPKFSTPGTMLGGTASFQPTSLLGY